MGDNYLWRGGNAKFDTVGQWSDQTTGQDPAPTIPGPSDNAIFDLGGTVDGIGNVATLTTEVNVTFTGSITAQTFAVDGDSHGGPATVTVSSGAVLTGAMQFVVSADATVNVDSGATIATNTGTTSPGGLVDSGSISVNGGTAIASTVIDSASFTVTTGTVNALAVSVNGSGVVSTLDIGSGGLVADSSSIVGAFDGGGSTATVHSGGTWTNSSSMGVGLGGAGTLEIESGGNVSVTGGGSGEPFGAVTVGLGAGVTGAVTIDGGTMSVTANADIGATGTGNLSVSGGGSLSVGGTLDTGAFAGASGTLDVSDDGAAMTFGNYIIGDAGAHDDSIDGAVSVDVTGSLSIGAQSTGAGTLTLSGGGSLSIGGDATVGDAGSGSLDIGDGSSVTLSGALTLAGSADGKGTITLGQDVTLAPGGSLTVGSAGTASISVAAGAELDGSAFVVGGTTAAAGTITLGGTGAKVLANVLTVGGVGTGVISIAADSTVDTSGNLTLGQTHGGGNGMITVAGSGDLSVGGNLTVGSGGIGSLDVNGGSLSIAGSMDIADGPASAGDVTFAQANLSIGTITVGNQGTATFSANQAATVIATNIVLGQAGVGNGTFNLDGAGSEVQASQLSVGGGGTGALQVTDKSSFQVSGLATMGASASSKVQETATIETNASWTIGGILDVGEKASGQITVDTGGQVAAAQSVVIGDTTKASGTVTVTGTGTLPSALGFGSLLQVGNDGVGTLAVAGGAQVGVGTTSGAVEIAATTGANGIVTLTGTGSELQSQVLTVGGNEAGSGGAGTLAIGSKSEVSVADATVWATGTVVMTGGTLATDPLSMRGALSGSGLVSGAVSNLGGIAASGGTLELSGSITGTGALKVSQGAELRLTSAVAASETIGMAVKDATLRLGKLADIAASISGFAQSDTILVDGVTADAGSFSGHTLTLTEAGESVGTLELNGSYAGTKFHVATATGGSDVTIVACFAAGTRLLTAAGEVAVEALAPGDLVATLSGRLRPVKWIGHRSIYLDRHPRPCEVRPVRVQAHGFSPDVPHRDLLLSPDHAVFAEGVLIPIRYLINGATIRQESAAVVYYHVELDAHDVVLAEGLPAESYLDTGNRVAFENGGAAVHAYPDFALRVWKNASCAPLVVAGPVLAAARRKLLARAEALGFALTTDPDLHLFVDGVPVRAIRDGARWRLPLPRGARGMRLLSRGFVPARMCVDSDDHRCLGVAIAGLAMDGHRLALDDPRLTTGWHAREAVLRWTDGDATVLVQGARTLELNLATAGVYWRETNAAIVPGRACLIRRGAAT